MHYINASISLVQVSYDTCEEPVYHYAGSAEIHDYINKKKYDHVISAWSHRPFVVVVTFVNGDLHVFRSRPMPFLEPDTGARYGSASDQMGGGS